MNKAPDCPATARRSTSTRAVLGASGALTCTSRPAPRSEDTTTTPLETLFALPSVWETTVRRSRMDEQAAPSRRFRMLLVAGAVALLVGVGAALTAAAPNYSDWSTPVNLGPTINTAAGEGGAALSKDGLSLYFESNRPGGFGGGGDIWVSQRESVDGDWGAPVNVGA